MNPEPTSNLVKNPAANSRANVILWMLAVASLFAAGSLASRAIAARTMAGTSLAHHDQVLALVNELKELRSNTAATIETHRPKSGLTGQVTDALLQAGVPITALTNLSPDAETEIPGGFRRQLARLALDPVTLPSLGRFLQTWRSQHPEWTVSAVQILPLPNTPPPGPTDAPAPVHVNLTIECTYVADAPS